MVPLSKRSGDDEPCAESDAHHDYVVAAHLSGPQPCVVQRGGGALRPEMQQKISEAYQAMKAGADPEKVRQHMIKNYGVDINQYRE